jgi:anti-sigma regulatory factor (Ser/Thr protein kinase)
MVTDDRMATAVSEGFTIGDLSRVRMLVTRACEHVGLGAATDDFVTAVNEIAINAIRHAGGCGHLTITASDQDVVVVEIADTGPGFSVDGADQRPGPGATDGRGLWLARLLCPTISFTPGDHGMTVRLIAGGR